MPAPLQIVSDKVAVPDGRTAATIPWALLTDPSLPSMAKLLAAVLGGFMSNARLECYPALSTLARIAGVSRRTAMRAVAALEAAGWLEVTRRSGRGIRQSSVYRWRDPKTGLTAPVRGSSQMEAALLSLARGGGGDSGAQRGDSGAPGGGDRKSTQTTDSFLNKADRSRETAKGTRSKAPASLGTVDWRSIMRGLPPEQIELLPPAT